MSTHCGFSISAKTIGRNEPGVFISGKALERGAFKRIIPLEPNDYVPVWEGGVKALTVIVRFQSSKANAVKGSHLLSIF